MTPGMDVLLVGPDFEIGQNLPDRLRQWGCRCHFAGTILMASEVLRSQRINVVLITTHLPDGSGFGLVAALSGLAVTAFLCAPVENGCFWVPAIDCGRNCWGSPALWPAEFTRTLEKLVRRGPAGPSVKMPTAQTGSS